MQESRWLKRRPSLSAMLPLTAALLSTVVTAPLIAQSFRSFGKINDLPEYYAAARLVLSGKGFAVYNIKALLTVEAAFFPQLQHGVLLFLPPPAVPLLCPLGLLPAEFAPAIWTVLLVLAVVLSIALLKRWLKLTSAATAWLWSMIWLSGPAYEAVRIGQLAPLLLMAQIGGIMLAGADRTVPAALCFAAFALKPQQIAPLLFYLAGAGRWRIIGVFAAAITCLCLLAYLEIGREGFADYLKIMTDPAYLAHMQPELNPTVRGQLLRFEGVANPLATGVALAFMSGSLLFSFLLGRRMAGVKDWLMPGVIAAVPIGLATSLHLHDYDLLLLVPPMIAFVGTRTARRLPPWGYVLLASAFGLFLLPFYEPIHYEYLKGGGLINPYFLVLFVFAILVAQLTWRNRHDFQ